MTDATLARWTAEQISKDRLLDISELASGTAFIARFSNDEGLAVYGQNLIKHNDGSWGLVIRPDGSIPNNAEAAKLIWPDREVEMTEEVTAIVELIYDCGAEDSLSQQADHIKADLSRLISDPTTPRAMCVSTSITYTASEANTYGTDESRTLRERQAERLQAALGTIAYPDDHDDPQVMLRNALCDLRHFADEHELSYGKTDAEAHAIYLKETNS